MLLPTIVFYYGVLISIGHSNPRLIRPVEVYRMWAHMVIIFPLYPNVKTETFGLFQKVEQGSYLFQTILIHRNMFFNLHFSYFPHHFFFFLFYFKFLVTWIQFGMKILRSISRHWIIWYVIIIHFLCSRRKLGRNLMMLPHDSFYNEMDFMMLFSKRIAPILMYQSLFFVLIIQIIDARSWRVVLWITILVQEMISVVNARLI